jgi:hypothetical protein
MTLICRLPPQRFRAIEHDDASGRPNDTSPHQSRRDS